jgi:hypothetical protein
MRRLLRSLQQQRRARLVHAALHTLEDHALLLVLLSCESGLLRTGELLADLLSQLLEKYQ